MADRSADSYRRPAPSEQKVTTVYEHPLTNCPDCGTLLTQLKQITRYIEDIANLTELSKLLKTVENVKQFVACLVVVMRLSFEQVRCFLTDTADLALSDGEITACLDQQAEKLTVEKDRLLAKIRGTPGRHYDETGWKVQQEGQGNYCWISRPAEGEETVFLMGRSRGKGNAEELRGIVDNQVGINDEYGAYQNLFTRHQLCMAHPQQITIKQKESSDTLY